VTHLRGARLAVAALSIAAAACTGVATSIGGKPGPEAGLLRGRLPLRSAHVTHVDRLTDGVRVVAVDADSDDSYTIALSADGVSFAPLWTAPAVPDRGVQPRAARDLDGHGRYLRLTASGGDGAYAVAEVSVAAECPPRWPPVLAPQYGTPADSSAATKAWLFAALAAAYVLAYRRKLPDFFKLLVAAPLGVLIALLLQLSEIWPPPSSLLLPLFAAPAIVGAAVGIRMVISRRGRGARSTRT
jgi:hypothetical protein